MDTTLFTDPTKIGPGIWFTMHTDAASATSEELKRAFVKNINTLCDNFKCAKCQGHFRKFIDTHPFEKYWNIKDNGKDIGFFKWTWEMHNQVNKFLKKYEPSLEEAYGFYTDTDAGVCFDCGVEEKSYRTIPAIITSYKEGNIKPKPFRLISRR